MVVTSSSSLSHNELCSVTLSESSVGDFVCVTKSTLFLLDESAPVLLVDELLMGAVSVVTLDVVVTDALA